MNEEMTHVEVQEFSVSELLEVKDGRYLIPLYQRGYTWGKAPITMLLSDLWQAFKQSRDTQEQNYYLGTLVVMRRDKEWEVVDGQQRLTTLSLIYRLLDQITGKSPIVFESRPSAEYFLDAFFANPKYEGGEGALREAVVQLRAPFDFDEKTHADCRYSLVEMKEKNAAFIQFLRDKVKIFRVELPEETDVSAYFEIMNTRGKQLQDHEVLKAKLMWHLEKEPHLEKESPDEKKRAQDFDLRWIWCSDFSKVRWQRKSLKQQEENGKSKNIKQQDEDDERASRESNLRLTFQDFLLLVLSVYLDDQESPIDNKRLIKRFEDALITETFRSSTFLCCMEVVRDYLDYVLVGSSLNEKGRLTWDLSEELEQTLKNLNIESDIAAIRHLQSLLMITQGTNKNWIRDFLLQIKTKEEWGKEITDREKACITAGGYEMATSPIKGGDGKNILQVLKRVVCKFACRGLGLKEEDIQGGHWDNMKLANGTATSPIVLNLLDYLFWEERKRKDTKFVFRERDSIEHFYPQDPKDFSEGERWKSNGNLNTIGNLCLITRGENSWLSNNPPSRKVEMWHEREKKGEVVTAPKQAEMYAVSPWTEEKCKEHDEMCRLLLIKFLEENGFPGPPSSPVASKDGPNTSGTGENGSAGE